MLFTMKKTADTCFGKEAEAGKSGAEMQSCYEAKLTEWGVLWSAKASFGI